MNLMSDDAHESAGPHKYMIIPMHDIFSGARKKWMLNCIRSILELTVLQDVNPQVIWYMYPASQTLGRPESSFVTVWCQTPSPVLLA